MKFKVYLSFWDESWGVDFADILLCVIDVYNKYAWVVLLMEKTEITITNVFQDILEELDHKPKKKVGRPGQWFLQ